MINKKKKTVSLVLGSGGARGYAHIGVIKELIANDYEIKSISGSSIGALIGGLYAAGKLEEYEEWVLNFDVFDILKLVDFSFNRSGMINGEKVFNKIEEMIGDVNIEDLPISFTATATDITNRKQIWLQKGSLKDAIRASIAIPTVFTPKKLNDKELFDGGILNPLPIIPTISEFTDLLIAVDLNSSTNVLSKHKHIFEKEKKGIKENISNFFKLNISKKEELSYFEIINKSIETMQEVISRYQLASHQPDIMINIPNKCCEFYDFQKAKELITYGSTITKEILEDEDK
ncbi:patatin-like phospholipase family protein [Arcobacter peruensis]|uniref:patatin-like phospholipase family protein n=1 Tax=Arcobacter peruensis TaxID=2320140 RepID=UPI000F097B6A|nr:patatin-like phospholipase family protein [Arcobacter peruensis]